MNGYKIVLKQEDDGTDPAKASEAMKKLLAEGVVAIVGENATAQESVWAPLATEAGVPIIGGGAYSTNWTANPLYFPVTTTAILDGLQAGVQNAADNGIKKLGATYDAAIPQAAAAAPLFENYAKKYGMTWTDGLGVDVNAADFTAQCVKFKQDGSRGHLHRLGRHRAAAHGARLRPPAVLPDLPQRRRRARPGRADQGPEHQGPVRGHLLLPVHRRTARRRRRSSRRR